MDLPKHRRAGGDSPDTTAYLASDAYDHGMASNMKSIMTKDLDFESGDGDDDFNAKVHFGPARLSA